jgi:hypothetical protein
MLNKAEKIQLLIMLAVYALAWLHHLDFLLEA